MLHFFSQDYPIALKELKKPLQASHSTKSSRMRQPGLYSEGFMALNLAVADSRLHLWKNKVHGPAGIPHSLDKHHLYQLLTNVLLKTITDHDLLHNVSCKFCLNPRDLAEPNLASSIEWISDQHHFGPSTPINRSRNEFAFRLWFKSTRNELVSRILLLFITKQPIGLINSIRGYQGLFGNVDLMLIPSHLLTQDRLPGDSLTYTWHQQAEINQLSASTMVSISRYLDHGQLLNLGELHQLGCCNLGSENSMASIDPYQQYLHDFNYHVKHAPNGCLMKVALPSSPLVLHQTAHKAAIIESNEMRISRAGCMGNMVYTTLLSGNNMIGGHAIGLYERSHPGALLTKDNFILFQVNHLQNRLTNWIEKLGRGRLFLDARNRMLSSRPHKRTTAQKPRLSSACAQHAASDIPKGKLAIVSQAIQDSIELLSNDIIPRYANVYPLLAFVNLYGSSINKAIIKDPTLIHSVFSMATRLINKSSSHHLGSNESVLNNIFFETIKDYILLYQSDVKSNEFKTLNSFYMGNVYSIFFELHPELQLNWNTGSFPIQIDHVIKVLTRRNIITPGNGEIIFKKFFLDRLAYYIQVCCLEGCLQLPTVEQLKSFDDLANILPNFAGILFNDLIKSTFKKTALIEQYTSILRSSYDESYDERSIDVAIKCGASWTEEFGIRSRTNVRFFDFKLSKNRHGLYEIETQQPLGLTISGISETNGFTTRFSSLDKIRPDKTDLIQLSNPMFDISQLAQYVCTRYYLIPFPSTHALPSRQENPKFFQLSDPLISRMTHGAMHASRVCAFVKIIHGIRVEQGDQSIHCFDSVLPMLQVTLTQCIHLMQIAALFHDVSRQDEGEDFWDEESADQCLAYMKSEIGGLPASTALLIANTIRFKDNSVLFIASARSIGLSEDQAIISDYLRQLLHDADCLDIMRVRKTYKTKFLDLCHIPDLQCKADVILALVTEIRALLHHQGDLYHDCQIQGHWDSLHCPDPIGSCLDPKTKYKYEGSSNIYLDIIADMAIYAQLQRIHLPLQGCVEEDKKPATLDESKFSP